jgi:hypothetical protein
MRLRELEEARGHNSAHRVTTDVLGASIAAPIAKETRHRTHGADIEYFTKHVLGIVAPAAAALASVLSQHHWHLGSLLRSEITLFIAAEVS